MSDARQLAKEMFLGISGVAHERTKRQLSREELERDIAKAKIEMGVLAGMAKQLEEKLSRLHEHVRQME